MQKKSLINTFIIRHLKKVQFIAATIVIITFAMTIGKSFFSSEHNKEKDGTTQNNSGSAQNNINSNSKITITGNGNIIADDKFTIKKP